MEVTKYTHECTGDYSIKISLSGKDNIAMSTFSFSDGGVEVSLVGITSSQIAELVYSLEEIYQQIVMQEELNLDKLQSGIMEAKQVEQEVANDK
jgi:hypothetical protein